MISDTDVVLGAAETQRLMIFVWLQAFQSSTCRIVLIYASYRKAQWGLSAVQAASCKGQQIPESIIVFRPSRIFLLISTSAMKQDLRAANV